MFLLDSNVVINILRKNKQVLSYVKRIQKSPCLLSVITRLEVLLGAVTDKQSLSDISEVIERYATLPVDTRIADTAFQMKYEDNVSLKFKDLLIAATAKEHDLTVVTSDKDFKKLKGVQVHLLKL